LALGNRVTNRSGRYVDKLLVALITVLLSIGVTAAFLIPPASAQDTVTVSTPNTNVANVSIASGASNPGNGIFYSPANITVVLGVNNTVVWTNHDSTNHTVVASDNSYAATIMPGQSFSHTYTVAGVYEYHCSIHNWMKGSVIVLAGPSTSTSSSTGAVPEFPAGALAAAAVAIIVLVSIAVLRQTRRS